MDGVQSIIHNLKRSFGICSLNLFLASGGPVLDLLNIVGELQQLFSAVQSLVLDLTIGHFLRLLPCQITIVHHHL